MKFPHLTSVTYPYRKQSFSCLHVLVFAVYNLQVFETEFVETFVLFGLLCNGSPVVQTGRDDHKRWIKSDIEENEHSGFQ
jgi:hypothetical protein